MFINARPRFVSKGFEALVPTQRAESLHQRLVEMTNNEVNAWGLVRPVATAADNWDPNLDEFSAKNFEFHALYAGYYQDTVPIHQTQSTNLTKVPYAAVHHSQFPPYERSAMSPQTYDEPASNMNCVGNPSPMLGIDYSQWNLERRSGSFVDFSNAQNGLHSSYQSSNKANLTSFAPVSSSVQPQPSYQSMLGSSVDDILNMDTTCPSTIYSSCSSSRRSIDSRSLAYLIPRAHDPPTKTAWWSRHSQHVPDQPQEICGMILSQDGLPRAQSRQQHQQQSEWNNLWSIGGGSTRNWASTQTAPVTVSPKALTLNVPPAPLSSSGSSEDGALALSNSTPGSSSEDDQSDFSGSEILSVVEPPQLLRRPRQLLPDSAPGPRRRVPVVPSNGPANSPRKRLVKPKFRTHDQTKSDQHYSRCISNAKASSSKAIEPTPPKLLAPKIMEPKLVGPYAKPTATELPQVAEGMHDREAKDDFLVRSKLAGMSYKDIRRQGNFTEAESTLRGRFRTLTKHKNARVRKPEWCENDIRLLKKAVRKLAQGSDPSKCRVPWKKVAEYITNNGGSYHFGNATCRKRWDELQLQEDS